MRIRSFWITLFSFKFEHFFVFILRFIGEYNIVTSVYNKCEWIKTYRPAENVH